VAEEASQDPQLTDRKKIQLKDTSSESDANLMLGPYPTVDPVYEFPPQLSWVPARPQDAIWHTDHPTMKTKTPWCGMPFVYSWYSSAG
jgi:hypothetical protein